jgi:type II secretory pathway predicted ATPase ExeA
VHDNGTGERVNRAYPLTINNLAVRAMNAAAEIGEPVVTAELVLSL